MLFQADYKTMEKQRYTLLELSTMIGISISDAFPGRYWITAEINEIRENINGHCYLELIEKDPESDRIIARSKATIWAYTWRMLKPYFETSTGQAPGKGMMVLVEAGVEFHELYGLSLNIKDIDPVYTLGDMERKRALTIRRLEEEGIINMNKALAFPPLPSRIAVISSPSAAGYEDFIHQIMNNPVRYRLELTLFPAVMQGNNAWQSVTDALDAVFEQEAMFDLVVILRGGGSTSDLNCFDSYELASHIAQFPLPVITGIGHERDRTIAGIVAHTDLKTPTAVAGFLLDKFRDQEKRISNLISRICSEASRRIDNKRQAVTSTLKDLPVMLRNNLKNRNNHLASKGSALARAAGNYIQRSMHNLDSGHARFGFVIKNHLLRSKNTQKDFENRSLPEKTRAMIRKRSDKLILFETTIGLVDPSNILEKGYALVMKNGRIVKKASEVKYSDDLETKMHDGRIKSKVTLVKLNRKSG